LGRGRLVATGLVAAFLLAAAPFIPAEEGAVTGAVLCGFALGWAMLAVLSVRFTDQPQRWTAAPALSMGLGGLLLVGFGSPVHQVLDWVWPPAMPALAVWMLVRAHRQLPSPSRRWLLSPVIVMLALASLGGGYQTLGAAADAKAYPMPGQLIDVGGHRLHLNCTGSGTPTVVLEPAAGGMSSNLGWIAPAVARATRVCVYDRAGRGWSEPADTPQDGTQIATDLHTLLQRGHLPGPMWWPAIPSAASRCSPSPLATPTRSPAWCWWTPPHRRRRRTRGQHRLATGVQRRHAPCRGTGFGLGSTGSGPPVRPVRRGQPAATVPGRGPRQRRHPKHVPQHDRGDVQANASSEQAAALGDFADKPLIVLTAGSGHDAAWSTAQNRMATLSTNSVHRVIDSVTHEDLIADEDGAAATTQAILDVVSSVRSPRRLAG
jgi:hypothetical protein